MCNVYTILPGVLYGVQRWLFSDSRIVCSCIQSADYLWLLPQVLRTAEWVWWGLVDPTPPLFNPWLLYIIAHRSVHLVLMGGVHCSQSQSKSPGRLGSSDPVYSMCLQVCTPAVPLPVCSVYTIPCYVLPEYRGCTCTHSSCWPPGKPTRLRMPRSNCSSSLSRTCC